MKLYKIGSAALEKSFENVNGRTDARTDGRVMSSAVCVTFLS